MEEEDDLKDLKEEYEQSKELLEEADKELEELEKRTKLHEKSGKRNYQKLLKENEDLEREHKNNIKEIKEYKAHLDELQKKLNSQNSEIKALTKENERLKLNIIRKKSPERRRQPQIKTASDMRQSFGFILKGLKKYKKKENNEEEEEKENYETPGLNNDLKKNEFEKLLKSKTDYEIVFHELREKINDYYKKMNNEKTYIDNFRSYINSLNERIRSFRQQLRISIIGQESLNFHDSSNKKVDQLSKDLESTSKIINQINLIFTNTKNRTLKNGENILNRIPKEKLGNSCLLAIPVSSIPKNDPKLSSKSERLKKFSEVIENTLKIDNSKYTISHCVNILSSESKSYNYFIVTFSDKKYLDKFYLNQPYLSGAIIHKLIHPIFFPKLRNKTYSRQNLCINCNSQKNPNCSFELCSNCCNYNFTNPSNNYIKNLLHQKLGNCPCNIYNNTKNQIKENTNITIPKFEDYILNKFNSLPNCGEAFIQQYTLKRSINKLKLINFIRNGDFSWFKPIYDTNVTRMMLDMNKELTIIMDNPSYKREQTLKINDKMYKVFTYQIEKPIFNFYNNFCTEEYFDEIDSFLNLLEFKVKVLSAKEKQDAPKIIPGLAKGKWKYPKDINAFDNEVAEDFKEYL